MVSARRAEGRLGSRPINGPSRRPDATTDPLKWSLADGTVARVTGYRPVGIGPAGQGIGEGLVMVRTGRTSIVIPAYQEAPRLRSSMPRLATEMSARDDVEVVLVDDGSTDETSEVARQALGDLSRVTVVRLPWNAGKGSAVRASAPDAVDRIQTTARTLNAATHSAAPSTVRRVHSRCNKLELRT